MTWAAIHHHCYYPADQTSLAWYNRLWSGYSDMLLELINYDEGTSHQSFFRYVA